MVDGVSKERQAYAAMLAKALVVLCVRNGNLEDLHAGRFPVSLAGDNSDLRVVGPEGEVPWNEASQISDPQMRQLMKEVVNSVYTVLLQEEDHDFLASFMDFGARNSAMWDGPECNPRMVKGETV